jgi:hypothetical protein
MIKRRDLIALLAAVPIAGLPRWSSAAVSVDGLRLAWDYSRQRNSDSTVVVWQDGRLTASQIASASAASFFWRLT